MKIISIHFPKAGGSSLRVQFEKLLGSSLLLDYDHDPLGPNASVTEDEFPSDKRLIHGHFRAARYARARHSFRFTFLRNPVDNLLSIYFFWLTFPEHGNPWHSKFLLEKPAIEQFAKYRPLQRLMSETYFGGYDMSQLDFVGFHERRQVDISKVSAMINLPLDPDLQFNRTESGWESRTEIENDHKKMENLSLLLADDVRFFEKQRAKWS